MSNNKSNFSLAKKIYKLIDIEQSEVRFAAVIAAVFEVFFIIISFYECFNIFRDDLISIFLYFIAGLFSLLGISIAGIAIVITLFDIEQIKVINDIEPNAFECLLYDFKWFGLVSSMEIAIFLLLIFIIKLPLPLVPKLNFYIITLILSYSIFYLLFYACSLIGNCIALSKLKQSLNFIVSSNKNVSIAANELKLDFLISKLFNKDIESSTKFYNELIEITEQSNITNKNDIVEYLRNRHSRKQV